MITPQSEFLLRMYRHYKAGILPHAGGILEQPHYYAEAMEILTGIEARIQAELAERHRAELDRQNLH
jgi:hypothetical protein